MFTINILDQSCILTHHRAHQKEEKEGKIEGYTQPWTSVEKCRHQRDRKVYYKTTTNRGKR
jgi:hypothetical protein